MIEAKQSKQGRLAKLIISKKGLFFPVLDNIMHDLSDS